MTRPQRILAHARHEAWMCALWISGAVASGVWAAVALMNGKAPGGALLGFGAAVALRLATWHGSEWRRLRTKVLAAERVWNPPPPPPAARMDDNTAAAWVALAVVVVVPAIAAAVHLIWKFKN